MNNSFILLFLSIFTFGQTLQAMDNGGTNDQSANVVAFPLHKAVAQGFFEEVKLLACHGAPLELRDDNGHTPLQVVFLSGIARTRKNMIASALIEAGANMEVLDEEKSPLLFTLIKKVDLESVALLLKYGVNVQTSRDAKDRLPLIYADLKVKDSENRRTDAISQLIQEYVDGRAPEYAALIQTQEEKTRLNVASHQAVLAALRQQREKLEEQMRLRELEKNNLELAIATQTLRSQIEAARKEADCEVPK